MSANQPIAETVHYQIDDARRAAWITLDRPPLNVIDIPMMRQLSRAVEADTSSCDFRIFAGAGTKAFSAGVEVADHTPERVGEMLTAFHDVFRRMARTNAVTIAVVHGHCLGGGMELATFCDFVIAAESAIFGQPEIKLACFPPVALITFPQLAGLRAALDLILTGRTISAREAAELGLVTRVVPDATLKSAVEGLLGELTALSPVALRLTRQKLRARLDADFDARLQEVEKVYLDELMKSDDAREGIRAFLEKRAPVWEGR